MKTSFTARCVRIAAMIATVGVAAIVVPVGEPDRASAATGCAVNYTVVRGDSWWRIKSKAGKSLSSVLRANGAKTSTRLLVGRTICLPAGSKVGTPVGGTPTGSNGSSSNGASSGCAVNYTVVRGDSWWRIKSKAGKSLSSVLRANGAKTSTRLLVGRTICLPAGSKVGTPVGGTPTTREASNRLSLGAPVTRYSTSASKRIIREVFPKRLESRALAIAKRESKYQAAAHNWCCVGLFQINWFAHSGWLGEMGVTEPEMLMDARVNAEAAYTLYKRAGGWGPWQ